ncbi:AVAST type 3 anti-phage proein Avs3b [Yersinia canariae]|uniref:AVAST type 3 anti-phage proein Avs3b n=1 Tax=Yersinia canariae TaxID=2607663 RepID=UPI0015F2EB11|nr:AVAST type 3 anti-phage proein Avs3b [Yersinia canariae]
MTEPSERYAAIIKLGKKLVEELALNDSVDTLGRWMAHHIAELIYDAENSADDTVRVVKQAEIRDSIWKFWANRYELPIGNKPFEELEPILRALKSLDPENQKPRYFFPYPGQADTEKESTESQKWLKTAASIDSTSKNLIDYCLSLAAENAIDKSQEWVELAQKAELDNDIDLIELRIFQLRGTPSNTTSPSSAQRRVLEKRQKNLAVFLSLAAQLDEQLKSQLETLPAVEDKPEKDDDNV